MSYPIRPRDARIHVFSVSDGALKLAHQTFLSRLSEPGRGPSLDEAFGAPIDETYAEVFAIADLAPMGLRDYLAEAHDIPPESLAREAAKLDGLSGDVVVLAPGAVAQAMALVPRPELTPIGAFAPISVNDVAGELPKAEGVVVPEDAPGRTSLMLRAIGIVFAVVMILVAHGVFVLTRG